MPSSQDFPKRFKPVPKGLITISGLAHSTFFNTIGTRSFGAGAISSSRGDTINTNPEAFFKQREAWLIQTIQDYVDHESPTAEPDRVQALGQRVEADCRAIGATLETIPLTPPPVCARFGTGPAKICLVFHHDTVWPIGSFKRSGREGNRWYGPGIFDMKANLPLALLSLEYLEQIHPGARKQIMLVSSPDEEVMGPGSREWVAKLAGHCEWALVFEPPLAGQVFKQRRKGLGKMRIRFHGVATHAGNHYASGRSALAAAARFLLAAESQTDLAGGLTVNVGLLNGGSAANTRPALAELSVDVRVLNLDQWTAFQRFVDEYSDPDGVTLEELYRRLLPPMNADHEGWRQLEAICSSLDIPFATGGAGGGSDGSNLSAVGVKVFDGLGIPGSGEHAENEHILEDQLYPVFLRNTRLITSLLGLDPEGL